MWCYSSLAEEILYLNGTFLVKTKVTLWKSAHIWHLMLRGNYKYIPTWGDRCAPGHSMEVSRSKQKTDVELRTLGDQEFSLWLKGLLFFKRNLVKHRGSSSFILKTLRWGTSDHSPLHLHTFPLDERLKQKHKKNNNNKKHSQISLRAAVGLTSCHKTSLALFKLGHQSSSIVKLSVQICRVRCSCPRCCGPFPPGEGKCLRTVPAPLCVGRQLAHAASQRAGYLQNNDIIPCRHWAHVVPPQ